MTTAVYPRSDDHCLSMAPAWLSRVLLPVALLAVFTGCLSRPALVHQTFALQSPAATNAPPAQGCHVLALRAVEVSPLFEGRQLVYRTGPESYEVDPYASLLVPSAQALGLPLAAYLRNSGLFEHVAEPGSRLTSDTLLEAHVNELYGDFRQPNQPAAVLSLRLLFFRTGTTNRPELFFQKACSRRIPIPQKTAGAVVAGWNTALGQIMKEVTDGLANAK